MSYVVSCTEQPSVGTQKYVSRIVFKSVVREGFTVQYFPWTKCTSKMPRARPAAYVHDMHFYGPAGFVWHASIVSDAEFGFKIMP